MQNSVLQFTWKSYLEKALWFSLFLLVLRSLVGNMYWPSGHANQHVLQAEAWLNGSLFVENEGHDIANFQGKHAVVYPPFPSLIVLPFVAAFGTEQTKPVVLAFLFLCLNYFFLFQIFKEKRKNSAESHWWAAALCFGTGLWFVVRDSWAVYGFSHVVAYTCLSAAVWAWTFKRNWALVGLLLGLAFLSRQLTVYAIIPFFYFSFYAKKNNFFNAIKLFLPWGACLAFYLLWNYLRFGNPLDTGYSYIPGVGFGALREAQYGGFSWRYVPVNFYYYFLQGFDIEFLSEDKLSNPLMKPFGTSLPAASPFLLLLFWVRKGKYWPWLLATGLALFHQLFYVNNGAAQINTQRFSLDFLPLLVPVLVYLSKNISPKIWKSLIFYSILLNVIALVLVGR